MSTTLWIQLLGVIFGVALTYFTFVKYKRKEISYYEFLVWLIGWLALIAVAIHPGVLDPFVGRLNFYRRLDFFVVLGFFILLSLSFYNYGLMRKLEAKLEKFVRKDALGQADQSPLDRSLKQGKDNIAEHFSSSPPVSMSDLIDTRTKTATNKTITKKE